MLIHEVEGSHQFSPETGLQVPHLAPDDESAVTREAVVMIKAMMEKCILGVVGFEYRLRIDLLCSVWGLASDGIIFCWEIRHLI